MKTVLLVQYFFLGMDIAFTLDHNPIASAVAGGISILLGAGNLLYLYGKSKRSF